jgi:lauroyl/myristoyl acyltransferase
LRKQGYDVGVLVNRYAHDHDTLLARLADRILAWFRRQSGVMIFDKHETLRIVRFLQQGGVLGVLVDGNKFYSKMAKIEKLGRMCQSSIIPFAAYRSDGTGIVHIGCDLDRLVYEKPLDYMWFYRSRTI